MQRTAFVAGATGLVGGHCLRILASEPAYARVVALVRRPAGLRDERIIDYDHLEREALDAGADIFCALGTTMRKAGSKEAFRRVDHDYPVALARRARAEGARRFLVVSSVAADAAGSNFYLRTKAEMERDIAAVPFEAVHIFRPSFLIGERNDSRPAERVAALAAGALGFALFGSLRKYRAIDAAEVARAMVRNAVHGRPGVHIHHYDEMMSALEH